MHGRPCRSVSPVAWAVQMGRTPDRGAVIYISQRFGKFSVLRPTDKVRRSTAADGRCARPVKFTPGAGCGQVIDITVNDNPVPLKMKLGQNGAAYFVREDLSGVDYSSSMEGEPLPARYAECVYGLRRTGRGVDMCDVSVCSSSMEGGPFGLASAGIVQFQLWRMARGPHRGGGRSVPDYVAAPRQTARRIRDHPGW